MSAADTIAAHGIQNAQALVQAAAAVGLPTYIGVAFVEHESNGANVFGHDGGGAYSGGGTVTQAKYNDFLRLVRGGHTSNGVGPCQITYPGYFTPRTTEVANLWKPYENMVFGFKIIKGYLGGNYSTANLDRAGQIYNSGRANGAPAYGKLTVTLCAKWAKLLGTSAPSGSPSSSTQHADTGQDLNAHLSRGRVEQLQKELGVTQDGIAGPNTVNALEKRAGYKPDGRLDPKGSNTVKKMQVTLIVSEATKATHLVVDGILGPETDAQIDKYMKAGGRFTNLAKMATTAPKPPAKKPAAPKGTKFPLPKGHAYAANDGTNYTHSGVNKADQPAIKKIQKKVGVTADGIYGAKTKAAVKTAQKSKKVSPVDGEVGPTTWAALGL